MKRMFIAVVAMLFSATALTQVVHAEGYQEGYTEASLVSQAEVFEQSGDLGVVALSTVEMERVVGERFRPYPQQVKDHMRRMQYLFPRKGAESPHCVGQCVQPDPFGRLGW